MNTCTPREKKQVQFNEFGKNLSTWQFCKRDLFGIVSENVIWTRRLESWPPSWKGRKRSPIESPEKSSLKPIWLMLTTWFEGFWEFEASFMAFRSNHLHIDKPSISITAPSKCQTDGDWAEIKQPLGLKHHPFIFASEENMSYISPTWKKNQTSIFIPPSSTILTLGYNPRFELEFSLKKNVFLWRHLVCSSKVISKRSPPHPGITPRVYLSRRNSTPKSWGETRWSWGVPDRVDMYCVKIIIYIHGNVCVYIHKCSYINILYIYIF